MSYDLHSLKPSDVISLQPEQILESVMKWMAELRRKEGLPGSEAFFTPQLLDLMKVKDTMAAFEQSFMRYLQKTKVGAQRLFDHIMRNEEGRDVEPELEAGIRENIEGITSTSSYTTHVGLLNRGWMAAEELRSEYDLKLGMARKGLWLSHLFELAGWEGGNILSIRGGFNDCRINIFLEPDEQIAGKRVLLLDNDMMTGLSASSLARSVMDYGAEHVGVLTVYDHCDLSAEEFELGRGMLDPRRVLGKITMMQVESSHLSVAEKSEKEKVVMSLPESLPHVRRMHNLTQFKPEYRAFEQVKTRLTR